MKLTIRICLLVAILTFASVIAFAQENDGNEKDSYLPSEAVEAMRTHFRAAIDQIEEKSGPIAREKLAIVVTPIATRIFNKIDMLDLKDEAENESLVSFLRRYYTYIESDIIPLMEKLVLRNDKNSDEAMNVYFGLIKDTSSAKEVVEKMDQYYSQVPPRKEYYSYFSTAIYVLFEKLLEDGDLAGMADALIKYDSLMPDEYPTFFSMILGYNGYLLQEMYGEEKAREILKSKIAAAEKGIKSSEERIAAGEEVNKREITSWNAIRNNLKSILRSFDLGGQHMTDIELTHFINRDQFSMEDLEGKIILIDFFANWCGPCKAAFPYLAELHHEFNSEDVVVMSVSSLQGYFFDDEMDMDTGKGLSVEKELELTKQFAKHYEMEWPVTMISKKDWDKLGELYGLGGIPAFLLIDQEGKIRMFQTGNGTMSHPVLKRKIERLLKK